MPRAHRPYNLIDIQGRPRAKDAEAVVDWRTKNSASIAATARRFSISPATVKRYGKDVLEGMSPRRGKEFRTDPKEGRP